MQFEYKNKMMETDILWRKYLERVTICRTGNSILREKIQTSKYFITFCVKFNKKSKDFNLQFNPLPTFNIYLSVAYFQDQLKMLANKKSLEIF